jgi:hypothetical protein
MTSMRRVMPAGAIVALMLVVASFYGGRLAEQRVQRLSDVGANERATTDAPRRNHPLLDDDNRSDHVLIANIACVSFGELWSVMRAATPEKRGEWAREIEELPPGTQRGAAIDTFYKVWVELDPPAAIRSWEAISNKALQLLAGLSLTKAAPVAALPEIAERIDRLRFPKDYFGPSNVIERWAQADPEAAARFLALHPDFNPAHFADLAGNWAKVDPEKAAEWVINLRLPPFRDSHGVDSRKSDAAKATLVSWFGNDAQGATAFAIAHADDPDFKPALGALTRRLWVRSPDQARTFVEALPGKDAQRAALEEIIRDSDFYSRRFDDEESDREEPKEPEIVQDSVAPWVTRFPAELWQEHLDVLLKSWDQGDRSKSEAWLRGLSPALKSKAITDFCASAGLSETPRVFELLNLVDASIRDVALQKLTEKWRNLDGEFRKQIEEASLTSQQKQILLQHLDTEQ